MFPESSREPMHFFRFQIPNESADPDFLFIVVFYILFDVYQRFDKSFFHCIPGIELQDEEM